ncbi:MAG: SDR family NAD(P)-dependent oxidoreductase, partial [Candidatus Riflebacteria bacterium]|nr:SDR family NAD(P)-dependent oxidoreductase [Candidatus Riflebacteria bacterium]
MRLKDRVAVVTGAARGIGLAVALRFVEEGSRVALWDVLEADLTAARDRVGAGADVRSWVVDVTKAGEVAAAMDQVERDLGPVDVLVNNAGITRDA